MLDAAIKLLKQKKPIFPVDSKKTPLVVWKEYQTRLPSERDIKGWFAQWPNANIGMATGKLAGVIVIDCDDNGAINWFVENYPAAKETLQVQTGRGRHFYFKYATGIRSDTGKHLHANIHVRSEGGYAVVPPSVHENGSIYKYIDESKKPIPLPWNLREALLGTCPAKPELEYDEVPQAENDQIPEGQRNSALTQFGGLLRRYSLSPDSIEKSLLFVNQTSCKPPLSATR